MLSNCVRRRAPLNVWCQPEVDMDEVLSNDFLNAKFLGSKARV